MENDATALVFVVSYGATVAAFMLLALISLFNWKRTRLGACLIAASLLTVIWAAAVALGFGGIDLAASLALPLETLRSGSWILFLYLLLKGGEDGGEQGWILRWLAPLLLCFMIVVCIADFFDASLSLEFGLTEMSTPMIAIRLIIAISGLLLIENLFRNTSPEGWWGLKYLCLGLGTIFVYDIYLYADGLLFRQLDTWLLQVRGIVNAVVAPLIAVSAARNPHWKLDLFVSRRLAFYSATLMASGGYLIVMSLAGYYLRQFGGTWGDILLAVFILGAALLFIIALSSGRIRTRLKVFINKHFFNYRYDYRTEWLRFINTISGDQDGRPISERAIQAIADIVDSPGGALLKDKGNGVYGVSAVWNVPSTIEVAEPADSPFTTFLKEKRWIVDLDEAEQSPEKYDGLEIPEWTAAIRNAWLVVPLVHHDELTGMLLLQEARAKQTLNWEDHDILKTVGQQVASYLAEQEAIQSLAEARQFEAFNRRFAFVLHDIKNLVSQLSLMTANAERHAGNPEFQRDMVLTVQESVTKMKALLERLHSTASGQSGETETDIVALLKGVTGQVRKAGGAVELECPADAINVRGEGGKLATVFEHVIQNALDAVAAGENDSPVRVDVSPTDRIVVVTVVDEGEGMDEEFIRNDLFRPFKTTKEGGYGIGAYESREIVKEAGGQMDVLSAPGAGTKVIISLMKVAPAAGRPARYAVEGQ